MSAMMMGYDRVMTDRIGMPSTYTKRMEVKYCCETGTKAFRGFQNVKCVARLSEHMLYAFLVWICLCIARGVQLYDYDE